MLLSSAQNFCLLYSIYPSVPIKCEVEQIFICQNACQRKDQHILIEQSGAISVADYSIRVHRSFSVSFGFIMAQVFCLLC